MRYLFTATKIAKIKRFAVLSVDKDVEHLEY